MSDEYMLDENELSEDTVEEDEDEALLAEEDDLEEEPDW